VLGGGARGGGERGGGAGGRAVLAREVWAAVLGEPAEARAGVEARGRVRGERGRRRADAGHERGGGGGGAGGRGRAERGGAERHAELLHLALLVVRVELEHVEDRLRVLGVVLARDGRLGEQLGPLRREAGERARDGVEADVDLVHEVGRVRDAHERRARVDVVLPAVELVVRLEREPEPLVLGLDEEAVRLEVGALDVGDVAELDGGLDAGGLCVGARAYVSGGGWDGADRGPSRRSQGEGGGGRSNAPGSCRSRAACR
jgi:hypothetical protein